MAGFAGKVKAQDTYTAGEAITYQLDAMRILDVEGTPPSLHLVAPAIAGVAVRDTTCATSWLNYTSIIAVGATNKITVSISNMPPTFTTLTVTATAHAGTGNGTYGSPAGTVTFSAASTASDLITQIGSCWTGIGNTNGSKLTYSWGITAGSYASAVSVTSASDITATYTIVAGS